MYETLVSTRGEAEADGGETLDDDLMLEEEEEEVESMDLDTNSDDDDLDALLA